MRVRVIGALLALLITIVCILASVQAPSSDPARSQSLERESVAGE